MPTSFPTRAALAAAAVLTASALAACSTSTDGNPVGQSGGRTGSAANKPSGSSGPASAATLRSTLLTAGDLPSTWTSTPHDASDDQDGPGDDQLKTQLATCLGFPADHAGGDDESDEVHSPDFKMGQSEIDSSASPADPADTKLIKQLVDSPKTGQCFQQALQAVLAKQLPAGAGTPQIRATVTGRQATQPSNVLANFNATVTLSVQGRAFALYINSVDIASDTVEASVDFEGFGAPIPTSVSTPALAAVAKRVAAT